MHTLLPISKIKYISPVVVVVVLFSFHLLWQILAKRKKHSAFFADGEQKNLVFLLCAQSCDALLIYAALE